MIRRVVLAAAAVVASSSLMAQTNFLSMASDPTSLSLAGANGASNATSLSVTHNMASVVMSDDQMSFGASMMSLQPQYLNSQLYQVGGYYSLGDKLSVGAAFRYEGLPEQSVINSAGLAAGSFSPMGMAIDLGAGYAINENLAVGASLRYIYSDIYTLSDNAFGVNLSANYQIDNSTLALMVNNLGTQGESIEQPTNVEIAAAHTFELAESHALGIMASGSYIVAPESLSSISAGVAAEYGLLSSYFLRVGYRYGDAQKYMPSYTSLGVGVGFSGVRLDASYLLGGESNPLNNSFMVGLSWSKKK